MMLVSTNSSDVSRHLTTPTSSGCYRRPTTAECSGVKAASRPRRNPITHFSAAEPHDELDSRLHLLRETAKEAVDEQDISQSNRTAHFEEALTANTRLLLSTRWVIVHRRCGGLRGVEQDTTSKEGAKNKEVQDQARGLVKSFPPMRIPAGVLFSF